MRWRSPRNTDTVADPDSTTDCEPDTDDSSDTNRDAGRQPNGDADADYGHRGAIRVCCPIGHSRAAAHVDAGSDFSGLVTGRYPRSKRVGRRLSVERPNRGAADRRPIRVVAARSSRNRERIAD
jgi:hypothetical protein